MPDNHSAQTTFGLNTQTVLYSIERTVWGFLKKYMMRAREGSR